MFEFEKYKENLDVVDKYGIKDVNVDKCVIYQGSIDLINRKDNANKHNKMPPLGAAFVGVNNTAAPLPKKTDNFHAWTDIDAQESYLKSKPTRYLILGKPGSGCYSLGEALSKKFNCVHLCPKNIIQDELDQNSSTGKTLDFNFRHNKICKFDICIQLLKTKILSPAVQHRGFVISGFPMVTSSKSLQYFFDSFYGEESVDVMEELMYDLICNMKKKKAKKPKKQIGTSQSSISSDIAAEDEEEAEEEQIPEEEQGVEEEQEPPVQLPKFILDTCTNIIFHDKVYVDSKAAAMLTQFQEVINMAPDIIIYVSSPDIDLMTKKSHKYFNFMSNQYNFEPFTILKEESEIRWPTKYAVSEYTSPFDTHIFNPKYICRQPYNFKNQSRVQMCNYKQCVMTYIQNKLEDYDPKFVLKLDGRTSTHEMMHQITERLILLPIKPVLIPEPLYLEEAPEDLEEFWKLVEELNVIQSGVVRFNKCVSPWYNRCPVELKNRLSVQGRPKFAAMFFKHVYLLSSLNALILFCRNPRPFLKLKYLEPTCRVVIIGTQLSGKTMISECLSWIFDVPVISFNKFTEEERLKKYETYAKTILSEIIATIEDARLLEWQNLEIERYKELQIWCDSTIAALHEYIPLLEESIKYTERYEYAQRQKVFPEEDRISELEIELEDKTLKENIEEEVLDESFWEAFKSFATKLQELPFLNDIDLCNKALVDGHFLTQYAPINLITAKEKPGIPTLGDEDVTSAISAYIIANDLQKEIEPTTEELMNELIRTISDIDLEVKNFTNSEHSYGKYIIDGFPSDPEFWNYLTNTKYFPDYTISLLENKEIDIDLAKHYLNIEKCIKNHIEKIAFVDDPLINTKLITNQLPSVSKLDVHILINDTIDRTFSKISDQVIDEDETAKIEAAYLTSFTESVEKFREELESLKPKIEENAKAIIEVELESKTDIEIISEVLLQLRKSYAMPCDLNEDEESEVIDDEDATPLDLVTSNNTKFLCETNSYCPIAYYDYGVLWDGKLEFSIKYNNKIHYFCKEECLALFQNDATKYQSYNQPYKKLPPVRICVVGCIGSGKSTVSKYIAKELGLMHIDFEDIINDYLMPRHFKKVGRRYENSFTDTQIGEETTEFHMDEENENQISDILSNEKELRRMVNNYLEQGTPIISALMQRLLKNVWFQSPFVTNGFVLDGYPRLVNDVDDMVACFCIPDIIITLESSIEKSLERVSTKMFKTWKIQLNDAKNLAKIKLNNEKQQWMNVITKNVVVKLICDEIIDKLFMSTEEPNKGLSVESVIIDAHPSGSSNVDANLFNTYNEMIQEFPEPIDQSVWEKPSDARERIDARIEGIYEIDDENIQTMKDILFEQKIKFVSIDGTKKLDKILRMTLSKLKNVRNRNVSFFEQTFVIDTDISEMLLAKGVCFLSKFNRMCPVYIHHNQNSILHPYKVNKKKGSIFPVVHRCYIYFMCSEGNLKEFRLDPLKFINSNAINSFYGYPLRLSVIGAPKGGRSSLADKLAKRYGLICISRGKAIRKILENMRWTELGSRINKVAQQGEIINGDLIVKAVQTAAIDYRMCTSGFVFDGFPDSPSEALELSKHGLYPNVIFDLSSTTVKVLQNSQNEVYYDIIKLMPPYSASLIQFKFETFKDKCYALRDWVENDYQNLISIDGTKSKWQCLQDTIDIIAGMIPKIHYYLCNENSTAVPVDVMGISNDEFNQNMSNFKDVCPLCLRNNILRYSGYPVDKKGVVRFKQMFYWVCPEHMDSVLKHPFCCLTTSGVFIPEIPAVIKTIHHDQVYENGVCIVTYAEHLPAQKIVTGCKKIAASFRGKNYMFCSDSCLLKFLEKPHMFCDITVFKQAKLFPQLPIKKLPDLGYLEQSIGTILTDACCALNVARPKYPGLSIEVSGLLFIALYLKTHNPFMDKSAVKLYDDVFKTYQARCNLIIDVGLRLRSMDNPFAKYPKCCEHTKTNTNRNLPSSISSAGDSVSSYSQNDMFFI